MYTIYQEHLSKCVKIGIRRNTIVILHNTTVKGSPFVDILRK
jgi:hypothetical protein